MECACSCTRCSQSLSSWARAFRYVSNSEILIMTWGLSSIVYSTSSVPWFVRLPSQVPTHAQQGHNTENLEQIFPGKELRTYSPNSYTFMFLWAIYIFPWSVCPQSTYFTVRGQSYFSRLPKYWPPIPLSARRVCPPPATKVGVTHSPGGVGDGGSIFWKTREIGLPSYSKICTLWVCLFCSRKIGGPKVGIYRSLTDTWTWKLWLRPRQFLFWEYIKSKSKFK